MKGHKKEANGIFSAGQTKLASHGAAVITSSNPASQIKAAVMQEPEERDEKIVLEGI